MRAQSGAAPTNIEQRMYFFSQRSRIFYQLPRQFPWDTFRPIFQPGAGDRFAGVSTRILPFDPLSFARLSRTRPPRAGFSVSTFNRCEMTDYASVYPQPMSIAFAEGCITWISASTPAPTLHAKYYCNQSTLRLNY